MNGPKSTPQSSRKRLVDRQPVARPVIVRSLQRAWCNHRGHCGSLYHTDPRAPPVDNALRSAKDPSGRGPARNCRACDVNVFFDFAEACTLLLSAARTVIETMSTTPADLDELRRRIDEIDDRLQDLLIERLEVVSRVAAQKRNATVSPYRPVTRGRDPAPARRPPGGRLSRRRRWCGFGASSSARRRGRRGRSRSPSTRRWNSPASGTWRATITAATRR